MRLPLTLLAAITTSLLVVSATNLPPQQKPMKSDPSFPQFGGEVSLPPPGNGGKANLADCLTIQRSASLFFEYARDISSVSSRLLAGTSRTTLLVPNDKAIAGMKRKPHQSPSGQDSDDSAAKNVEKFLSAHIIPTDVDLKTGTDYPTLLKGLSVKILETPPGSGKYFVQPGNIAVQSVKEASNGRILYIDGVIAYAP